MPLIDDAKTILEDQWERVQTQSTDAAHIPPEIQSALLRSVNSKAKTYRYVLPTQLLAKAVDVALDCRSIQATSGLPGKFDARSLAQDVIVPFDRANHSVLGGAPEPYANNPLRIPAITPAERNAQKFKQDFDDLILVLDYAQNNAAHVSTLLRLTLAAIFQRLAATHIIFPVPNRVSFEQVDQLLAAFLAQRTGGHRLQAVVTALFRTIGRQFNLFADVRSGSVNAADASTGNAADLECVDARDNVVIAVEVKDRELALRHMTDKLPTVREKGITEVLFLVQGGAAIADLENIGILQRKEFATGQNLYVSEFEPFLRTCLILFQESGRRAFLQAIGEELEAKNADLSHRQKWRDLLAAI